MTTPMAGAPAGDFIPGGIFSPDALETNRSGHLTDDQRRQFGVVERAWRKNELIGAAGCVVVAVLLATSTGPAPNAAYRPFAAIALVVAAIALAVHAMPGADRLSRDLSAGGVAVIEGAMEKHTYHTSSGGSSLNTHYLDVADKHFEVSMREYEAAPSTGYVRLYYLPTSHRVVNLERLPDPPLPADAMTAPMETLKSVFGAFRSHDPEARHEAAAEMAQLGAAMQALRVDAATRPAADQRDPRPLSEAIVGSWRAGPALITFSADGTVELKGPGMSQQGHWSVDAQNRLHADGIGGGQTGEAWVVGDTLTLAADGDGFRLTRVAGT